MAEIENTAPLPGLCKVSYSREPDERVLYISSITYAFFLASIQIHERFQRGEKLVDLAIRTGVGVSEVEVRDEMIGLLEPNVHAAACILLVVPDGEHCSPLRSFLTQEGFVVELEKSSAVLLQRAVAGQVGLIVLDVVDPSIDGMGILRKLRPECSVPVLAITEAHDPETRISALELGADGCVMRPWDAHALAARVRALLRRSKPLADADQRRIEHSGVILDRGSREVRVEGRRVDLTTTEFDILDILMRSAGSPVSRETVIRKLYNRAATGFDRSINVHVSNLRRKLESGRILIKAVRGTGYQFCLSDPASELPDRESDDAHESMGAL